MLFSHAICPPPLLSPGRPYPLPPNPHRGLTLLCAWPHSLRMAHPLPAPKVAIPRIGPFAPPQDRSSSTGKPKPPRTDRACDSCRKRKIRCSGEQPHCQSCLNQLHPCVYPQARKDRLKDATAQNTQLLALLRDLSAHVDEAGQERIDDFFDSLAKGRPSAVHHFHQPASSLGKRSWPGSTTTQGSPRLVDRPGEADVSDSTGSNENADLLDEDLLRSSHSRATGYVGQNSEVQWLRSLKTQLANASLRAPTHNLPYAPPGSGSDAIPQRPYALHGRRSASSLNDLLHVTDSTFYLDSDHLDVDVVVDPYKLPPPDEAKLLFDCYMNTVHTSFPIVPRAFQDDFNEFNNRMRQRQPCDLFQKWRAILNLVFAIGAYFSHLAQTQSQADGRVHLIYMTRAIRLLGLDKAPIFLSAPDLPLIQATGLLSLYYLIIGHASKAWVIVGISLRFALAAGLHLRNEDPNAKQHRKEHLVQTWWSLHAIETLLCASIGRPCVISNDECTVPLPHGFSDEQVGNASQLPVKTAKKANLTSGSISRKSMQGYSDDRDDPWTPSFLVARVKIAVIMQKALTKLYSPRTASSSWECVQKDIASLAAELNAWAAVSLPEELTSLHSTIQHAVPREQLLLAFNYHSTWLLISRPCLCRLERRIRGQSNDSATFNNNTAEACVEAAHAITRLLPDQPDTAFAYHQSPWWCIVHNIMQAIAVFLLEISFGESHMKNGGKEIAKSTKKLIRWLQHLSSTNTVAERAYQVTMDIIKTGAPRIRIDISDILSEEAGDSDRSHPFPDMHTSATDSYPPHMQEAPPMSDLGMGFSGDLNNPLLFGQQAHSHWFLSDPQYLMLDPDLQLPLTFGNPFMTNFDQPDILQDTNFYDPAPYYYYYYYSIRVYLQSVTM
ncbi:hypothetical protein ACJQWK_02736 [Exserohilum turcicum]